MAPWPEQGSEPKAPDKDEKRELVDANAKVDLDDSCESTISAKSEQKTDEKEVLTLDEGQLKALLDEAITYKNPKDREGKSELFKELLQEAEADESDSKGLGGSLGGKLPRAYYNLPVRRRQSRHGGQSRECGVGVSSTRGGSLQNLHALGMEGGRRSRKRDTLVSARQREGGSLPTNVNVDNDPDLDIICPNYTSRATLEVSGHNKEENASKEEPSAPTFLKVQGHHHLPNGTETQSTKEVENRVVETVYASSINQNGVHRGQNLVENSTQDVIPPQGDILKAHQRSEAYEEDESSEGGKPRKCICRSKTRKNGKPQTDGVHKEGEISVDKEKKTPEYNIPYNCHTEPLEEGEHPINEEPRRAGKISQENEPADSTCYYCCPTNPPHNDITSQDDGDEAQEESETCICRHVFIRPCRLICHNECSQYDDLHDGETSDYEELPVSEISEYETEEEKEYDLPENDQVPLVNEIESYKYYNSKFPVMYRRPDGRLELIECVVVDPFNVLGDGLNKTNRRSIRGNNQRPPTPVVRSEFTESRSKKQDKCVKKSSKNKSSQSKKNKKKDNITENSTDSKRGHNFVKEKSCLSNERSKVVDTPKSKSQTSKVMFFGGCENILNKREHTKSETNDNENRTQLGQKPSSSSKNLENRPCLNQIGLRTTYSNDLAKTQESKAFIPYPGDLRNIFRESKILGQDGETLPSSKKPSKIKDEKSGSCSLEKLKSSKQKESETVSPNLRTLPMIRRLSAIERRALTKKVPVRCIAAAEERKHEKQGVGPVESGAMLYPSTPVQHVSVLSIPPSQIHAGSDDHRISDSPEAKKLNVIRSRQHKKGHPTEETDNASEGLLGLPLTAYWNRYSSFTLLDFQGMSRGDRDATKPIYTACGHPKFVSLPKPSSSLPTSLADLEFGENIKEGERPTPIYTPSNPHNLPLSIPDYQHAVPGPSTATLSVSTGNTGPHSRGDSGIASQFTSISGTRLAAKKKNRIPPEKSKAAPKGEASAAPVASEPVLNSTASAPSGSKKINRRSKQKAASRTTKGDTNKPADVNKKKDDGAFTPPRYLIFKNPRYKAPRLKEQTIEDPLAASQPSGSQGLPPLSTPEFLQSMIESAKKRLEALSQGNPHEFPLSSLLSNTAFKRRKIDRTSKAASSGDFGIPILEETPHVSHSLSLPGKSPVDPLDTKKKNWRTSKATPPVSSGDSAFPFLNKIKDVSPSIPLPVDPTAGKNRNRRRPKVTSTAEVSSIPTPRETDVVSPLDTYPVSVEVSDIPLPAEPAIASPSLPVSGIPPIFPPAAKKKTRIDWSGLRKCTLCPIEEGSGECCDDSSIPHPSLPLLYPSPNRRKEIVKHVKRSPKPSLSTILEHIGEYVCNESEASDEECPEPVPNPPSSPVNQSENRSPKPSLSTILEHVGEYFCNESEASDEECPEPVPNPPSSPVNQSKNRSPKPSLSTILEHIGEYVCNESEASDEECPEPVPNPPSSPVNQSENHPTTGEPVEQEPYVPQGPPFPSAEYLAELELCRDRIDNLTAIYEAERAAKNSKGRPKVTSTAEVSSIPTPRETDVVSPLDTYPVSVEVSDIPLPAEPAIASPSLPVSGIPPIFPPAAKKKTRRRSKPTPATEVPVAPIPRENTRVSQTLPVPDRPPVAFPATDDRGKPTPKERLLISYSPDNQGVLPLPTPDFLQNIVDQAMKRRPKVTSTAEVSSIPTPRETDVVSPLATHPISVEVSDIPLPAEPAIASPSLPVSGIPPIFPPAAKKKTRRRSKPTPATEVPVAPIPRENTRVSQTLPVPDRPPVAFPATDDRGKPTPKERLLISYSPDNQGVLPLPTPDFLQNIVDHAMKRKPKVTPTNKLPVILTPRETDVISPLATHPVSVEVSDIPLPAQASIASLSLIVSDIPPVASRAAKKKTRRRSKPTPATEVPVAPIPRENTRVSQTLPVPDRPPVAFPATDDRGKPTPKERLLISYSPDNQGVLPLPTPDFLQNIVDQAMKRKPKVIPTNKLPVILTPRETDVAFPLDTHPVSVEVSDIPLPAQASIASLSLIVSDIPPVASRAAKKKTRRRSKPTPATEVPVAPIPRENTRVSQTLPVPDRPPVAFPATDDRGKPRPEDRLLISYSPDTQGVLPFPSPDFLQDMVDKAKKRFDDLLRIHASELPSIPLNSPLLAEAQYKRRKMVERTPHVFTGDPGIPFLEEADEVHIPLSSEDSRIPSGIAPLSSPLPGPSGHPPPIKRMQSSESTESAGSPDEGPRYEPCVFRINPNYTGLTERAEGNASTRLAFGNTADGKTKPLDENGNALACVRMDSNCLDRKKQRRVKAKNDRNTILSDEIEGFRGGADIDTLMEYIESPSLDSNKTNKARTNQANGTRNSVKVRAKEEEPRSIKRRKDKFQRCNSLEEISKTKLEDLTEEGSSERVNGSSHPLTKKQVTLDDAELGKKSSWEEMVETAMVYETKDQKQERISPEPVQDSEFHVVTKKQRKKKKRSGCSSRGGSKQDYYSGREAGSGRLLYQYRRDQGTSQPRRKSASSVPPSDKSDSSDLDSVHSLPASSTATRARAGQNSVSGGSTPQASYADIARTAASPPDGSQVNIDRQERCSANSSFTESYERMSTIPNPMLPMPLASFKKDAMTDTNCDNSPILTSEDYPPLEVRSLEFCTETVKRSRSGARDSSVIADRPIKTDPVIPGRDSGDGPQSLPTDFLCVKSSDTSSNKRPPVILMHDPSRGDSRVPEIQFGFPVNYQLLQNEDTECNETVDLPPPPSIPALPSPAPVVRDQGGYSFIQDQNLVQYLSATWEEIMEKVRSGKARYYDGQ